ncbi:MAG: hypothetical protein GY847_23665 [Proteobacteria bacterium]|nr:hypothetical protein [Pseudomonadota bacterium]
MLKKVAVAMVVSMLAQLACPTNVTGGEANPGYIVVGGVLTLITAGSVVALVSLNSDLDECEKYGYNCDEIRSQMRSTLGVGLASGIGAYWCFTQYQKKRNANGLINIHGDTDLKLAIPDMSFNVVKKEFKVVVFSASF